MIIVSTESVPGHRIARALGIVRGNTVRSCHAGDDILAFLKNLVGGELAEYTEVISQAREQALDRMIQEARELGADAVVGVRFSSGYLTQGAAEILAYGTAVAIDDTPASP
ncbi:MAG: YbjQ family protein [Acidobacteria bacterium]|nr:YbjQ family protein [Acidobacteriota bacterium]